MLKQNKKYLQFKRSVFYLSLNGLKAALRKRTWMSYKSHHCAFMARKASWSALEGELPAGPRM